MMKMPVSSREALVLLNGIGRGERRGPLSRLLAVILGLAVLVLGFILVLLPDIKRYLRLQKM